MATCARSCQILKHLGHQFGNLSISKAGTRHIHLAGRNAAFRKGGLVCNSTNVNTDNSRQSSTHCGTTPATVHPAPLHGLLLKHNTEIKEKEKPKTRYDCPRISNIEFEIDTPFSDKFDSPIGVPERNENERIEESPENKLPAIKLKQKMRNRRKKQHLVLIRKKKMKRHQLLRVRKKLWPIRRKQAFKRRKKIEKEFQVLLETIRDKGRTFDAAEYVQQCLTKAKRSGYRFDVTKTVQMIRGK